MVGKFYEGVIGYADDAFARIAINGAESVELFQEDVFEACLFFEFTAGSLLQGFFDTDEASGERPAAFERLQTALNEKDLEFPLVQTEDDTINGEGWASILVTVSHASSFFGVFRDHFDVLVELGQIVRRNPKFLM